ncbi:MAG: VanZ family protein [Rhodoglobus sp.]
MTSYETAPPRSRARVWLATLGLVASVAIILLATMWPTPLDQGYQGAINKVMAVLHRNGVPKWFGYNKLEFSANIAMFIPLGFLVALLLPQKVWWLALLLCPGLSVAIELIQGAVLDARVSSALDVLANSLGALIGILVAVAIRALVYQRDQKVIARALWERGVA